MEVFLNIINNRLERINGKLKQLSVDIAVLKTLSPAFFVILTTLRTERDHNAVVMFQEVVAQPFPNGRSESNYIKFVTSHAASYVVKQLELAPKVKEIEEKDDQYVIHTSQSN